MLGGSLPNGGETLSEYWARRERESHRTDDGYLFRHARPVETHDWPAQRSGSATASGSVYTARPGAGKQPIPAPAGGATIPDDTPALGAEIPAGYAGRMGSLERRVWQLEEGIGELMFQNMLNSGPLRRKTEERRGYSPDDIDAIAEKVGRHLSEHAPKKTAPSIPDIPQKMEPVIVAQTSGRKAVRINGEKYGPYGGGLFTPSRNLTVKDDGDVYIALFTSSRTDENWTQRLPKLSTTITEEFE